VVNQTTSKLLADAVFEGGGVKGTALVGAAFCHGKRIPMGKPWQVYFSYALESILLKTNNHLNTQNLKPAPNKYPLCLINNLLSG